MRENRTYGSEGGEAQKPSLPLSVDCFVSALLYARLVSSAILTASPASTVPISQRCTNSHVGRVPRNSAIDPAASAMAALTLTLIAI
jgi:hypothetical protein